MGKNAIIWGKIALLARHERTMIALFFLKLIISNFWARRERSMSAVWAPKMRSPLFGVFERDVSATWARLECDVSAMWARREHKNCLALFLHFDISIWLSSTVKYWMKKYWMVICCPWRHQNTPNLPYMHTLKLVLIIIYSDLQPLMSSLVQDAWFWILGLIWSF